MSDQEPGTSKSSFSTRSRSSKFTRSDPSLTSKDSTASAASSEFSMLSLSTISTSLTEIPSSIPSSIEDQFLSPTRVLRSGRVTSLTPMSQSSSSRSSSTGSSSSRKSTASTSFVEEIEEIIGEKLPSKMQVLGFFLFIRNTNPNMTSEEISQKVHYEIARFYSNVEIPMKTPTNICISISEFYKEYKSVKQSLTRSRPMYPSEKIKADAFVNELPNLFDISTPNAIQLIDDPRIKNFLAEQRKPGRPGSMRNLDERRQTKVMSRISLPPRVSESEEGMYDIEEIVQGTSELSSELGSDDASTSDSHSPNTDHGADPDFEPQTVQKPKKKHFITEELVSALDSCKISNPCAMRVIMPILKGLTLNPDDYVFSAATLRRRRQSKRTDMYHRIQDEFIKFVKEGSGKLVKIHWDGKTVQNITNKKLVERIAVKAICENKEQIIGCIISGKKGIDVAHTVFQQIQNWELGENVVSLCFDTTYVNSGNKQGAAIRLERLLGKDLQFFPCRHHIYELILRLVYEFYMGETKSDTVKLFGDFKKCWEDINTKEYSPGISDVDVAVALKPQLIAQIKEFTSSRLKNVIFRSDYREFLELVLLFLGEDLGKPKGQVIFHPPGADHHARWMAKAIYALKIFMFRHQFNLSESDIAGLRQVCIFIIKYYVKLWFRCSIPAEAPHQDFNFLKMLLLDKSMEKELVEKCIKKICGHLWYICEESVALSFFDPSIPREIKQEMVVRLRLNEDHEREEDDGTVLQNNHRVLASPTEVTKSYLTKKFSDFVTPNSIVFFERFRIPTDFLLEPTEKWESLDSYQKGLKIVNKIKVTNDSAEKTVQLMTEYIGLLTKKEIEYQELIVVVDAYHDYYPTYSKKDLVKKFN